MAKKKSFDAALVDDLGGGFTAVQRRLGGGRVQYCVHADNGVNVCGKSLSSALAAARAASLRRRAGLKGRKRRR